MATVSTIDRCKWTAAQLKAAKNAGDLTTELALQIRLDQLLDKLHREQSTDQKDRR